MAVVLDFHFPDSKFDFGAEFFNSLRTAVYDRNSVGETDRSLLAQQMQYQRGSGTSRAQKKNMPASALEILRPQQGIENDAAGYRVFGIR